jgi:pimeloyl-ACP methyl ester carboxylesterase
MALIGHSMGGLVARAACHAGTEAGHTWSRRVRHVVTLGTPHHGAPLAKAAHLAAAALRMVPETEALAHVLDTRSAGIRDLRYGVLREQDWRGEGARSGGDTRQPIPRLRGCRYTFVTATVSADPTHPLGWLLGDLLVRTESASGRCSKRVLSIEPDAAAHVGGIHHLNLLDHPLVGRALLDALTPPRR